MLSQDFNGESVGEFISDSIKKKHPWITELAINCNLKQNSDFNSYIDMISQPEKSHFPLSMNHIERTKTFIKDTLDHFHSNKMDQYLEDAWEEDTALSHNTAGILRAMVFRSKSNDEMLCVIHAMAECHTIQALREWIIATAISAKNINYNTCIKSRKLFWCVIHLYKIMAIHAHTHFDDTANVKSWNRTWFNQALKLAKTSSSLKEIHAAIKNTVTECDALLPIRKTCVDLHSQLMPQLRAAILDTARPKREIHILRDMMHEVKSCKELDLLLRGIPIPPFNPDKALTTVKKISREISLIRFMDSNDQDLALLLPLHPHDAGKATQHQCYSTEMPVNNVLPTSDLTLLLDSAMISVSEAQTQIYKHSTTSSILGDDISASIKSKSRRLPPSEILHQAIKVRSTIQLIQTELAETAAEMRNLMVTSTRELMAELGRVQDAITHAATELQTIQSDQWRRTVRSKAKQIRMLRDSTITQMLPFSVEMFQARAVHEGRQRAKNQKSCILALIKETKHLLESIQHTAAEEAILLAEHTRRKRRLMFMESAPHFLPIAMFEREVECGVCLEVLKWETDPGIRFVTCCPEYGYTCARCLALPHRSYDNHTLVAEQEIVRIVRCVRREIMGGL